ncbi:unnamed protein product [Menidia menidia]|uniref:(Atlantic silverside) hypothetical protein n=1 Tax=Menidia menidia TaxID=238744 RepID=A0A8S4BSL9_9TELE|nr:unnamed protein product [Menidia menidia]
MDKTQELGEEVVGKKVPENDSSVGVQPEDVETGETGGNSAGGTEAAEGPLPESAAGDNLCAVCGFTAKHARSLKIHHARKHGKNSDKTPKSPEPSQNVSDVAAAEIQQETAVTKTEREAGKRQNQTSDLDEMKSAASDDGSKSLTKKQKVAEKLQEDQDELILTQERRVSKRIPKPKIIYSCNYCGQEFRDKSPLDVHVKRYHAKDVPFSFDADENVEAQEESEDHGDPGAAAPARLATKRALSRFQLKCPSCDFRVSTAAVLERHARVKHPATQWFRCKVCNFFAATSQWMDAHLSSDGHSQQQNGKKAAEPSSFDACVETVSRDGAEAADPVDQMAGDDRKAASKEGKLETSEAAEGDKSELGEEEEGEEEEEEGEEEEEDVDLGPPRKKRGRPKQGSTTTCGYCGLVVSNATNLSVHVRRKHSKDYGYSCTLCNYNCVTKGDMDRHCFTKKHVKRVQEGPSKNPATGHTSASMPESTSTPASSTSASTPTEEPDKAEEQTQPDAGEPKGKYDSVNACSLCDFVAQSIPSLHLHVKRKHTKDFEFVCLACGYYAVTSREMYRHASTDKHKQKSQRYLALQGGEGQKAPEIPAKPKIDESPSPDSERPDPPEAPGSSDSQDAEVQSPPASSTSEAVAAEAGGEDEKQAETITSSADAEPGPTDQALEPAAPLEPQQVLEEPAEEKDKQTEDEGLKENVTIVDTQMSKAPPFDASIVSVKALAEQEHSLEGEPSAVCLTGGAASGLPSPSSAYVRKLKSKEAKTREEARGGSSRIRCEDCGFMADGISGLNVHISMKHPSKERHFHCLVCGKSFYTESNLHQHLTSAAHLRNEQNSVEELPEGGASFKCVKCTDRFESEQDLFFHIKEKHEELLREVNKYVLEDTEQINREREENQGSVCKYCGKVCKSSNSMAFLAHIRTHTGSKPFMCKICNFATAQLGDARNHVKRHLGMREYKCDICGLSQISFRQAGFQITSRDDLEEQFPERLL